MLGYLHGYTGYICISLQNPKDKDTHMAIEHDTRATSSAGGGLGLLLKISTEVTVTETLFDPKPHLQQ